MKYFICVIFLFFSLLPMSIKASDDNIEITESDLELLTNVLTSNESEVIDNVKDEYDISVTPPQNEYFVARVLEIVNEKEVVGYNGRSGLSQVLRVEGLKGDWKGVTAVTEEITFDIIARRIYDVNDKVVVVYTKSATTSAEGFGGRI